MNVDLNWCPCGKQSREDSMYCSDACYYKDLASNGNAISRGKYYEKDTFFTGNIYEKNYNNSMNINSAAASIKIPEVKNLMFSASADLAFKNRQKYHHNIYNGNHTHTHNHIHHGHTHSSRSSIISSSYESTTSTIDDYFKGQALTRLDNSPKQSEALLAPKVNENAKEKTEVKSYSSRSSYVIEAVYPVQNFTKNTIAVY
jgi:hypothetical protein